MHHKRRMAVTVKIAVVGIGFGTQVHVPAFQSEDFEVVALCARRRALVEAAAAKFGVPRAVTDFEELLTIDGLDAVSITTPPALHHDMALAALHAGKHVICEKPFARNASEARAMADLAANTGLTAMVAHEFRFASARMRVKELIDEGYVGRPTLVRIRVFRGPAVASAPREFDEPNDSAAAGGGFLFRIGSHYVDALRHWLGEVVDVDGRLLTTNPERIRDGEVVLADADDTFVFTLRFANGAVAEMSSSNATPFLDESSVVVSGTAGILSTPQPTMNPPSHGTILGARLGDNEAPVSLPIPDRLEPFEDNRDDRMMPFRIFAREFRRGIETGTSPAPNFEDGYRCMQILDAVRSSAASGARVTLPA
jgi:predicted dehydrogenase